MDGAMDAISAKLDSRNPDTSPSARRRGLARRSSMTVAALAPAWAVAGYHTKAPKIYNINQEKQMRYLVRLFSNKAAAPALTNSWNHPEPHPAAAAVHPPTGGDPSIGSE
uniref:Uncharacterized protein n=1 Tax=Oryza glumipatula TaxID=40148 RepID=A0A0D9YML2_9ORYZ